MNNSERPHPLTRYARRLVRRASRFAALAAAAAAVALAAPACHHLDDDRIPPTAVSLTFYSMAEWNTYGVGGALQWRRFIKEDRVPANYPYTALSNTGFGGVLLVADAFGTPLAYDLACPFECRRNVRVAIDPETMLAECPQCHSTYDVFSLYGHPTSGPAADRGYGMRRFYVGPGRTGEYMTVSL